MHPTDIYTRNKTTWLAQSYLLATCDGLTGDYMTKVRSQYKASVSPSFHSRDILPDTGKSWRWAVINDTFYYAYNNIPDKAPSNYRSQLPSLQELTSNVRVSHAEAPAFEDHFKSFLNTHYTSYLRSYNDCTKIQQQNLSKAAAIMEGAIEYINTNKVNIKKYQFFAQLSEFIEKYNVAYFGSNVRIVKRKIEAVINGSPIVDIIKLPRADNDNASKGFSDEEIRSWVLQLRGMGANFTNTYIIRKIQDMCSLTLKPAPKDRWIGSIMEEHNTKFLTAQQRFGAKGKLAAIYRGYQPFQNALFAGDCWQIDGTRVNLVENKKTVKDKNGNEKKVTPFLYIVAVRDVHSGMVIGKHYTINEDHYANYCAIEDAIRNTGYLPYELVHDRFPGHNEERMSTFLETLTQWGVKLTVSSNPNSKSQLERWFGTLQTVFMQESKYYYGQGVKSRRNYAHRSEEYMKKLRAQVKAEGWDWDAACAEADQIVANYNNTQYAAWSRKHATVQQSPAALHEMSEKPNTIQLQAEDYAYLLGMKKELNFSDGAGLLSTTIQHAVYTYRVTDYNIISNHRRVLCCFDYFDLSSVHLYAIGDGPIKQYLGMASEFTPAKVYGPDAEWGVIAKRKAFIKDISDFSEQEYEYRAAVGDDIVSVMYPTTVNKHRSEAAETNYLTQNVPDFTPIDEDDTDLFIDPRLQY